MKTLLILLLLATPAYAVDLSVCTVGNNNPECTGKIEEPVKHIVKKKSKKDIIMEWELAKAEVKYNAIYKVKDKVWMSR